MARTTRREAVRTIAQALAKLAVGVVVVSVGVPVIGAAWLAGRVGLLRARCVGGSGEWLYWELRPPYPFVDPGGGITFRRRVLTFPGEDQTVMVAALDDWTADPSVRTETWPETDPVEFWRNRWWRNVDLRTMYGPVEVAARNLDRFLP